MLGCRRCRRGAITALSRALLRACEVRSRDSILQVQAGGSGASTVNLLHRRHAQPDAPTQAACNYAPPRSKLTLGRRACGASTDDKGASATESVACMNRECGLHE